MTWFQGTATGYLDLLEEVRKLATARSVVTPAISAAGTGYAVADVLTVGGGTFTHQAQLEVTSVGGSGEVTGVRIYSGGAYSVDPVGAQATTVLPSGGTGCTITLTNGDTGWELQRNLVQRGATDVEIVNDGTGYSVNDILTISGGTPISPTTLRVTAESSGAITDVEVEDPGEYLEGDEPSGTVSVTVGTATFTLTYNGTDGRNEMILMGVGSGAEEIFVGFNTFNDSGSGANNWELAGMTGYNPALSWENQPGKSPGEYLDQGSATGGAYTALVTSSTPYWMSITTRRIVVVAKCGSTYSSAHLGFLDPFATDVEYPYPMYIAGQHNDPDLAFNSTPVNHSSIADPVSQTNAAGFAGPGLMRLANGSWISVANSYRNVTTKAALDSFTVYPTGRHNAAAVDSDDQIVAFSNSDWDDIIPVTGNPGSQSTKLLPTPNSAGDLSVPVPCMVRISDPTLGTELLGQMNGVFWVSGEQSSTIISEDFLTVSTDRYRIFQSGPRSDPWAFFCVRED